MESVSLIHDPSLPYNILKLNLTHINTTQQIVSNLFFETRIFPIPPGCLFYRELIISFLNQVSDETHIQFTPSQTDSLISCIFDIRFSRFRNSASVVFEALLYDSVSWDASNAHMLLKEIVFYEECYEEGASCSICLDVFEQGCSAISTKCSHLFHGDCIDKWIRRKGDDANCPICRCKLFSEI